MSPVRKHWTDIEWPDGVPTPDSRSAECQGCGEPLEWYPSDGPKPALCATCRRTVTEARNAEHRREAAQGKR